MHLYARRTSLSLSRSCRSSVQSLLLGPEHWQALTDVRPYWHCKDYYSGKWVGFLRAFIRWLYIIFWWYSFFDSHSFSLSCFVSTSAHKYIARSCKWLTFLKDNIGSSWFKQKLLANRLSLVGRVCFVLHVHVNKTNRFKTSRDGKTNNTTNYISKRKNNFQPTQPKTNNVSWTTAYSRTQFGFFNGPRVIRPSFPLTIMPI